MTTLSAKLESDGASDSGFAEFRGFIRNALENGELWRIKFESVRDTVNRILAKLLERLCSEKAVLAEDRAFYQRLLKKLASRREKASSIKRLVIDSLCGTYDGLVTQLKENFNEGLSVGTILKRSIPYVRDKNIQTWIRDLESQFKTKAEEQIETSTQRVSMDLDDEIHALLDELTTDIEHRQQELRSDVAGLGTERADLLAAWRRGESASARDDGIVTATEVGTLKLEGTELVVLSACETGVGEAKSGEGVLGLRRGFIQAGAQNLLMTLWSVADEETAQIMAEFYERFHASKNAPQALAEVQRDWLVRLRNKRGLLEAVVLAGPFILSSQGPSYS